MADGAVEEFEAQRPRVFGLAYRLLGSAQDAEDVVQDTFLRWHRADRTAIAVPSAWLVKVAANLCLNRLTSARVQRERYVGPWLPEPVLTSDGTLGPLETAEQRDLVSLAMLVLLERLTPTERAVFILREAFEYSYREIAQILELSEVNCRQLDRRARKRLAELRPRFPAEPRQWHRLVERFLVAAHGGDLRGLEQLLASDVTAWADGGGKVTTARRSVTGSTRVARYLVGTLGRFAADMEITLAEVNAEPALLGWSGGDLLGVLVLEIVDGRIRGLRVVANPDKVSFAARQAASLSRPGLPAGS